MQFLFTIPSTEESLDFAYEVCTSIMRVGGMEHTEINGMQLAVEEAVINSIRYAYEPEKAGLIELMFDVDSTKISITVRDFGKGFDPQSLKIYDVNDMESIASTSGRGFYLMQTMTDEFGINSSANGGTEIYLSKNIGGNNNAD